MNSYMRNFKATVWTPEFGSVDHCVCAADLAAAVRWIAELYTQADRLSGEVRIEIKEDQLT